jgi:DNA polymerase-3 subunit chi
MTRIGFYHLTRTPLEVALPRLLARVLEQGGRALVLVGSSERLAALDAALWATSEWLPHGTPATGVAEHQPIWLTERDGAAPNWARFLFLADGADSAQLGDYERVFDLFDGGDEAAVAAARTRWRVRQQAGYALEYWQQAERGWEKKAG